MTHLPAIPGQQGVRHDERAAQARVFATCRGGRRCRILAADPDRRGSIRRRRDDRGNRIVDDSPPIATAAAARRYSPVAGS